MQFPLAMQAVLGWAHLLPCCPCLPAMCSASSNGGPCAHPSYCAASGNVLPWSQALWLYETSRSAACAAGCSRLQAIQRLASLHPARPPRPVGQLLRRPGSTCKNAAEEGNTRFVPAFKPSLPVYLLTSSDIPWFQDICSRLFLLPPIPRLHCSLDPTRLTPLPSVHLSTVYMSLLTCNGVNSQDSMQRERLAPAPSAPCRARCGGGSRCRRARLRA